LLKRTALTVEVWSLRVASTSGPAFSFCTSRTGAMLHTLTSESAPPVANRWPVPWTCTVYTPPAEQRRGRMGESDSGDVISGNQRCL
jgi:hypothetical protein